MLGRDPHQRTDALLGDLLPNLDQGTVVDVMILDVPGGPVRSIGAFAFQELLTLSSHVRPEDAIFPVPSTSRPKRGGWGGLCSPPWLRFLGPSLTQRHHWSCWGDASGSRMLSDDPRIPQGLSVNLLLWTSQLRCAMGWLWARTPVWDVEPLCCLRGAVKGRGHPSAVNCLLCVSNASKLCWNTFSFSWNNLQQHSFTVEMSASSRWVVSMLLLRRLRSEFQS